MKSRLSATAVVAVALCSLTACGPSQSNTATPSPQSAVTTVVTVTRAPTTTPLPTETIEPTEDQTSTLQPVTPPVTTTSDGRSDYAAHFQRHESTLDLASDGTGTLVMGADGVDVETWAVTWQPTDPGVAITLGRRTALYGRGLEAGLQPGQTFSARFTTGETGNRVLQTGPIGPQIDDQIWCSIGGPSPECGA